MTGDAPTDLMFQDEIRTIVRTTYGRLPEGAGHAMASRLYEPDQLPPAAIAWSLGVGNPVRHAGLRPGDRVVDLGCGGGIDTVLAALAVGPSGRVVGVDTLPEMVERTRAAAEEAGAGAWCEVLEGELEGLPLPDESVDVVISNGVVNLSPRKSRALAEAYRVLRPGGRFCIADLTVDDDLPSDVLTSGAAWAGCIAGALSREAFAHKLTRTGFVDVATTDPIPFGIDDVALYPLFDDEVLAMMRRLVPAEAQHRIATSLVVQARRPDGPGARVRR